MAEIFMRDVTMAELESLLSPALMALGYEWWGGIVRRSGRNVLLRIYIDKDKGVTVDDCARASHQISALMALNNPISGDYTLEVSSPGLDRPLFKPSQYARFVGEKIKLKLRLPYEGQRQFQGIMIKVDEKKMILQYEKGEVAITFENIERANVVPNFSQVDQSKRINDE